MRGKSEELTEHGLTFVSPRGGSACDRQGQAPAEPWSGSCASQPGTRSKQGGMMLRLPILTATDCITTSCPPSAQMSKAENILKTKGWKRSFFPSKAENILKKRHL